MTVLVQLTPDTELKLRTKASQVGQSPEEFLAQLATQAVADVKAVDPRDNSAEGIQRWLDEFHASVASHKPVDWFVDDSRESIYEGRGE